MNNLKDSWWYCECFTYKQFKKLMVKCEKEGIVWQSGEKPTEVEIDSNLLPFAILYAKLSNVITCHKFQEDNSLVEIK